jgi:hypothetical protein
MMCENIYLVCEVSDTYLHGMWDLNYKIIYNQSVRNGSNRETENFINSNSV